MEASRQTGPGWDNNYYGGIFIEKLETIQVGDYVEIPRTLKSIAIKVERPPERHGPPHIINQTNGNYFMVRGDEEGKYVLEPVAPMISKKSQGVQLIPLGAGYYEGHDGYYVMTPRGTQRFTDFRIRFAYTENRVNIDGSEMCFYIISLVDELGQQHRLQIAEEEWGDLGALIDRRVPKCQIFHDAVSQAAAKFKRVAGLLLKKATLKSRRVQAYWGWGERRADGSRLFYHGGRDDCTAKKQLFPHIIDQADRAQLIKEAWMFLEVGPHNVTIPLVVYSMASYLDALFTDAGFPLNFSLMVVGDTGLLKTAAAKVVFAPCVFPVDRRIHNVRGTEAAMNLLHQDFFDDTLVIDDFNREGGQKTIERKMELIRASIRDYSDKSPREKFGTSGKVVQYAIRGGCVITGETRMMGQIRSAELRYLTVNVKQPLDGRRLGVYQQNPGLIGGFASEFIRFCEEEYHTFVNIFETSFPSLRNDFGLRALRLVDAYCFLSLTAEVIAVFLTQNAVLSVDEAEDWLREAKAVFRELVLEQAEGANQRDPYIRYVEEIFNLLGTGKLRLAPALEKYVGDIEHYDGFVEGGLLWFKKDEVYAKVAAAFASRGEYLPLSTDDASRLLKAHGLTKCDGNSCLKKASSKIPGRPRMLALIEKNCEKMLEELKNG